jgi:TusA-related sulfurtransferase
MGKYTQDQNDAYNDILEAGILASISRVTSTYDEVEETEVVTAVQTDPAAVMTFPASAQMMKPYDSAFIEDYKKGKNLFFYVAAKGLTFDPAPGDLLLFNSKVWELSGVTVLNPDGATPIIYTMGVKDSKLAALPVVP